MALGHEVQANIGRVARFADGSRRNWGLFFFFRVMPQQELESNIDQLTGLVAALLSDDRDAADKAAAAMQVALEHPAAMNARMVPPGSQKAVMAPAQTFLDWLKLLVKPDTALFGDRLKKLMEDAGIPTAAPAVANAMSPPGMFHRFLDDFVLPHLPDHGRAVENILSLGKIAAAVPAAVLNPAKFKELFGAFSEGGGAGQAGLTALAGGLPKVVLYELLRQIAPSHAETPHGAMRSEAAQDETLPGDDDTRGEGWDRAPINIAFTYSGLSALEIDETTLASFPTVFRQGMAARADVLGDTGPSAPENWDGVLGLDCVHGYFTGGFMVGDQNLKVKAAHWQKLRDDVQAYNNREGERGRFLRIVLRVLFMLAGMEILHIELGEDPHEVDDDGSVKKFDYRLEHFGFRDGISQPFVDMKLGDPPPGGGTPAKNRSWAPVAPGEIYLDQPDEDGAVHQLPIHPLLRQGSTFLVFRKLEQDVAAFRMYLASQRPGDRYAQEKLAAQFVGRWKNGTSLVMSPDEPMDLGRDPDGRLNNFLYAADDPNGLRCPLGSHARRANPRDIGDRDGVRRHRILRRAISFGGPLLPEGALGDGNRRGLLFIAANSRIDVQFELIQTRWINQGEFLGQAGLDRCPIIGANSGGPTDRFFEAKSGVPVTGIPRFVITRGGDYFFCPGISALSALADGEKFKVEQAELPYRGFSMGDSQTPILFDVDRLTGYADRILADGGPSVIRIKMPGPAPASDPISPDVAFIARLEDVKHVLSMKVDPNDEIINSVIHYHTAVETLSRGQDMLVSTERGKGGANNADRRERLDKILNESWKALGTDVYPRLRAIIKGNIEASLRRVGPTRSIDLVYDLASVTVYDIVCKLFGTPGPNWLTELAISLPFSQQHVSGLPPEWLTAVHFDKPDNVGLTTLQIWSILMFAQSVGNVIDQDELLGPSNQAGSEYLTYIDSLIATARTQPIDKTKNLLSAFVALEDPFTKMFGYSANDYYADVRMLLMELMGSMMTNIPATFGLIMQTLLGYNLPLAMLIPILLGKPQFPLENGPGAIDEDGIARLVYEATRINGPLKVLMRSVIQDQTLPSGGKLKKGEWVVAILAAASIDPRPDAFPDPYRFSLRPFMPGPERRHDNYLLFGATGGGRDCWGRDRLALVVLKECLKAAGRLQLLQRVAGTAGQPREVAMITIGLPARFTGVLPDWTA
ncbi:MAG TPA: hypothetical protein VMI56_01835 [Reyranella sp.]|nr:hypothetical protein [Reyranella sp.]